KRIRNIGSRGEKGKRLARMMRNARDVNPRLQAYICNFKSLRSISLHPPSARLCGPKNGLSSAEQEKAQDGGDDFVEPRHTNHLLAFYAPFPLRGAEQAPAQLNFPFRSASPGDEGIHSYSDVASLK
ncbi:MAG: hypothetical protein ACPL7E_05710, partial [bacterium]